VSNKKQNHLFYLQRLVFVFRLNKLKLCGILEKCCNWSWIKISSFHALKKYNLNIPETQVHAFHLFDSQERHIKKFLYVKNLGNGIGVYIPIILATNLLLFCFFFVNYIWRNDLINEIFGITCSCVANYFFLVGSFVNYLIFIIWILLLWFDNVTFENNNGYHNIKVNKDYRVGFLLFLASEVMFFFSIFWAFFHFSIGSGLDLGYMWPPIGIDTISYLNLPLFNTSLLMTSGFFVTWSHNGLKGGNYSATLWGLLGTIFFGIMFLFCQFCEYWTSNFNINDSIFGSIFFFGTGFHGMHVFLGTVGLIYNFLKLKNSELSSLSHYSYLFTIWYWHFVDLIWILLFLLFYVWGQ
jgi:cytochrome c oxidase subunit 3